MFKPRSFLFLITTSLFISISSCSSFSEKRELESKKENPQTPFLVATKYFQNSAEAAALYHQGYNVAFQYVDSLMKTYREKKPACVVLDIDETVLNNSYYQGSLYHESKSFSDETWDEWVRQSRAPALPGVVEYIEKVRELGVEVIFITNRRSYLIEPTLENLTRVGIKAERRYIVGRDKIHSKEMRRARFKKFCNIVQLIGDNLSDFSDDYQGSTIQERKDKLESQHSLLGSRYILLPNPMYGDWRKTILPKPLKKMEDLDSLKK
ncbi:MAG: 5'-nucleotidase, lipoprotein e(P4) family [Halobacteriovoraceae bacterium]|nr:5'-nucleotidase, lipoprotein e(P4) family [Halobacteriovoraceae bacterium]|tara:strand:+ start:66575 stop:67372 length:798 start_codon:yes stop_codon:yes gene_type:complete